ncbi:MAG: phosphatidylglycerophosphatase A [Synergistes sp.]|nr:phosphatidylglycerophosphatase A [Synergistes sp.]
MILLKEMKTWFGMVATVGTLGRFSNMPGTLGSAAGTALWLAVGGVPVWGIALAAVVGCIAADKYEKAVERTDPGEVVIDEVIGVWISCYGLGLSYAMPALVLFRLVDITKPFPIKYFEKLPGGIGIMADDMVGGVIVNVLLRFIEWLIFAGGLARILEMVGR